MLIAFSGIKTNNKSAFLAFTGYFINQKCLQGFDTGGGHQEGHTAK